jgi:branched-chain amino acid transport system substrate-binding protein
MSTQPLHARHVHTLIAAALVATLSIACTSTPAPIPTPAATAAPTEEPVPTPTPVVKGQIFKIYSSLPFSSAQAHAQQAKAVANAIDLALEQGTQGGTLCDGILKIEHVALDDAQNGQWDPFVEQANAYKANGDQDAMAYIGPLDSGAAQVSMPILNQGSLPMLSPAADAVGLTRPYAPSDPQAYFPMGKRNFMRLVAPLDAQGAQAAAWAKQLGVSKVFSVDDAEQFGRGPTDTFAAAAKTAGLTVVGRERINDKADNLPALAKQVQSSGADAVFYAGGDARKGGLLLKALHAAQPRVKFIGTAAILDAAFSSAAGDAAQGAYALGNGLDTNKLPEKAAAFATAYQARTHAAPDMVAFYGYEATHVVLAAAQKVCQKDRVALLDAMFTTTNFSGVLGPSPWSFDANGDISAPALQGYTYAGPQGWQVSAK